MRRQAERDAEDEFDVMGTKLKGKGKRKRGSTKEDAEDFERIMDAGRYLSDH